MQRLSLLKNEFDQKGKNYCESMIFNIEALTSKPTSNWGVLAYSTQPADLKRDNVAVLICDVVGYCRLMERNASATIQSLRRIRQVIVHPVAEKFGARAVRFESGDSMLVAFDSANTALRAGVTILTLLRMLQRPNRYKHKVKLRMGLSVGPAVIAGDGVYGTCVNVAGRLQKLAKPSSILVCEKTERLLPKSAKQELQPAGCKKLHNINQDVALYCLGPLDQSSAFGQRVDLPIGEEQGNSERPCQHGLAVNAKAQACSSKMSLAGQILTANGR